MNPLYEEKKKMWNKAGIDFNKPIYKKDSDEEYEAVRWNYIQPLKKEIGGFAIAVAKKGDMDGGAWDIADKYENR